MALIINGNNVNNIVSENKSSKESLNDLLIEANNINNPLLPNAQQNINIPTNATRFVGNKDHNIYEYDKNVEVHKHSTDQDKRSGSPSLFNIFSIYTHHKSINTNSPLNSFFDGNERSIYNIDTRYKSLENVLEDFSIDVNPERRLSLNDFLYLKYYKLIPMNRLIVLRRFAVPTLDNLRFPDGIEQTPIAQAISYFGGDTGNKLSELLGFNGGMQWTEMSANVYDVKETQEIGFDESGFGQIFSSIGGIGGLATGKAAGALLDGINRFANPGDYTQRKRIAQDFQKEYGNNTEFNKSIYGPVNVIDKTHIRGRSIGASKEYKVVFEYKMRSYNGINPRVAMLDLISNLLSLSYNNAKFWGGANRYFPKMNKWTFPGGQKGQDAFYKGDYDTFFKEGSSQLTGAIGQFISGASDAVFGKLMNGDFSSFLSGLGDIFKKGLGFGLDIKSGNTRPAILGFQSLLSGAPIGEWHLQIGNPYNPTAMIGNLICTNFAIEFSDSLGIDDFPDEVKFTITLKDARPRDKGDLESIINGGQGRIYYPPSGVFDIINNTSSTKQSKSITNNSKKSNKNSNMGNRIR